MLSSERAKLTPPDAMLRSSTLRYSVKRVSMAIESLGPLAIYLVDDAVPSSQLPQQGLLSRSNGALEAATKGADALVEAITKQGEAVRAADKAPGKAKAAVAKIKKAHAGIQYDNVLHMRGHLQASDHADAFMKRCSCAPR